MRSLPWLMVMMPSGCIIDKVVDDADETGLGLVYIEAENSLALQVFEAVGVSSVEVPMRRINAYGVGVAGEALAISVDGAEGSAPTEVQFDGYGYGSTLVEVPVNGIVDIRLDPSEIIDTTGPGARIYGLDGGDLPLPLMPAFLTNDVVNEGQWLVAGTNGVAAGGDNEIWWVPMALGQQAHQVADLPAAINGMLSAHIDPDGVADLVAWTDTDVLLLGGRTNGGYGWGGGWSTGERSVIGVVTEDANGDGTTDLIVGMTTDEGTRIEVLYGDGFGAFVDGPPLQLTYLASSISGSYGSEGFGLAVLKADDGALSRILLSATGWETKDPTTSGHSAETVFLPSADPGTVFLPSANLNNEDTHELILLSPAVGDEQQLVFYDLGSSLDAVAVKYVLVFKPFYATTADVDGDGTDDLLVREDDVLNWVHYSATGEYFISQATVGMGEKGPIAAQDFTGDGLADLVTLSGGLTLREGVVPDQGGWSVTSHGLRSYSLSLEGHTAIDDFDSDGYADVVGLVHTGDTPEMIGWRFIVEEGLPSLQRMGQVSLDGGVMVLDMAHCGQHIYALVGTPEGRSLYQVKIVAQADGWRMETGIAGKDVSGAYVACGRVPGSNNGFAVATTEGRWKSYRNDGTEVDSGDLGATNAIAMGDTDGDGIDELHSCGEDDCAILVVDLNGDGRDEIIVSGTDTQVFWAAETQQFDSHGTLSVDDVNADGWIDLLVFDVHTGTLSIHPGLDGGLAPAWSIRTLRELQGAAFLADVDQNGSLEFISVDSDGKLVHSRTN